MQWGRTDHRNSQYLWWGSGNKDVTFLHLNVFSQYDVTCIINLLSLISTTTTSCTNNNYIMRKWPDIPPQGHGGTKGKSPPGDAPFYTALTWVSHASCDGISTSFPCDGISTSSPCDGVMSHYSSSCDGISASSPCDVLVPCPHMMALVLHPHMRYGTLTLVQYTYLTQLCLWLFPAPSPCLVHWLAGY